MKPHHMILNRGMIVLITLISFVSSQPPSAAKHIPGLPRVTMFYHIPKAGGTSIRDVMPSQYQTKFSWGSSYSNLQCGVKKASLFHLTYDEMISCHIKPIPGPSLCTVRDPVSRFESEVRWRVSKLDGWIGYDTSKYVERMILECQKARRYIKADIYSHCQPQVNYLYKGQYKPRLQQQQFGNFNPPQSSSSSLERSSSDKDEGSNNRIPKQMEALCDYLLGGDLEIHQDLFKVILGHSIPRINVSFNKTAFKEVVQPWALTEKEIEWIHHQYQKDYEDEAIQLALKGYVLRRNGTNYKIVNISKLLPNRLVSA